MGNDALQKNTGIADNTLIGALPANLGVLHDVIGLGQRTEHSIRQPFELNAVFFEHRSCFVRRVHRTH